MIAMASHRILLYESTTKTMKLYLDLGLRASDLHKQKH